MLKRVDIQEKFKFLLGSNNVYYQPPANLKMKYPAIVYSLDGLDVKRFDNTRLINKNCFSVTHIYRNESENLVETMLKNFEYISFDNRSIVDGIYNDHYTIYW
jgi:hypothetical protein